VTIHRANERKYSMSEEEKVETLNDTEVMEEENAVSEEEVKADEAGTEKVSETEEVKSEEEAVASEEKGTEEEAETKEGEEETPKGVQKRINQLVKQREQEKRAHAATRKELETLKSGEKVETKFGETEEITVPAKPNPDDDKFKTYDDYLKAYDKYMDAKIKVSNQQLEQRILKKQAESDAEKVKTKEQEEQQEKINNTFDEGRKKYKDFDEVVNNTPASDAMMIAMIESENSTELAYYLGQHPDEADRISQLSPLAAARELGKIEAKLTTKRSNRISDNPPPITPSGSSGKSSSKKPEDMSDEEFDKWTEEKGIT